MHPRKHSSHVHVKVVGCVQHIITDVESKALIWMIHSLKPVASLGSCIAGCKVDCTGGCIQLNNRCLQKLTISKLLIA